MTGYTVCTYFVLVVNRGIIGVVACLGMTGLADTTPGFTVLIKGKVIRSLLKKGKVQSTVNMFWFLSYQAQVFSLYTGVGINGCIYPMRIMAGSTVNDIISSINQVIGYIGHGFRLAACTVTFFTFSFLFLTTGYFNYKDTTLNEVVMAITTTNCIA
jgi:hypothetical protein